MTQQREDAYRAWVQAWNELEPHLGETVRAAGKPFLALIELAMMLERALGEDR
jgi:hypothetical protein